MIRAVTSTSAALRLDAVHAFLAGRPSSAEIVIVGASRGAADDVARAAARRSGATFGLMRCSLLEFAARAVRTSAPADRASRRAFGTQAGAEANAARAVFEAVHANELAYFLPVAAMPGFPKALARTIDELRLAGVGAGHLEQVAQVAERGEETSAKPGVITDISKLLNRVESQLESASVDDRAAIFRDAADQVRAGAVRLAALPMVLLDVPLDSRAEEAFIAALIQQSPDVLATIPDGDVFALSAFMRLGVSAESLDAASEFNVQSPESGVRSSDLARLRRYVFSDSRPELREPSGDVSLFSAPGEGREAVEIVRRVLDEAARGVRFDEMAVFLRVPQQYTGLLEHACARGDVPVYFDRGTERPDPAGRAFVALLSCAVEGLSAKRFDEYLSLGQVPRVGGHRPPSAVAPLDEVYADLTEPDPDPRATAASAPIDSDDDAVVEGTLRSPWKWEELIVESAVVGGRTRADGGARWRRRLDGLAHDYRCRIDALQREEPESARIERLERDLRNLSHLRQFALPIIDELESWPDRDLWGGWLERFAALAARVLQRPARVLQTIADLRPMGAVGPVSLEGARDVLHDRLATLDWEPPARRYGRLFVGTPQQARGRSFRVAFVPGLAERVVPQRPREDPLLLDERRRTIDSALVGLGERTEAERLLLKLAIGAATERLYLSYPRLDVAETRARVPSFYALDVMRAITGRVPDYRQLEKEAAAAAGASLAWPAPKDPDRAIDDLEHDLATLRLLLDSRDPVSVKGRAHYLLGLNDALRRSVISRWSRGKPAWSTSDGLIRVVPPLRAAIDGQRLRRRPYSLSALQRFSTCPYQFLLATIYRLEPWDEPEPLTRMDPLTRGSLFHSAQAGFYRAMQAEGALPLRRSNAAAALAILDDALDRVASEYAEKLAPAIDRVWRDEIDELRRDLRIWVQKIAADETWQPEYFEFSFGLSDAGRDPRSRPDPVTIGGGYLLRGSVDLIERDPARDVFRVTDHKTGKNRSNPDLIVGGGEMLQPVLYSIAIEQALGKAVESGRLFYATTAGGFVDHRIPIDAYARTQGLQVLAIVDRAIESGFLPAAPKDERTCSWCDFRPVCGPREEQRVRRKAKDKLADLEALRSMR
ncbi:MAG TPA: PD-(D/E)XK nuclease family protein [Vicinamibacterales bacterium]|nr:PD-(D/E)XK nuclease family protein [Vicinamibacterales bacterium]